MFGFASISHKHQQNQALLNDLSDAIFVLKLQAQDLFSDYDIDAQQAEIKRNALNDFLQNLENRVQTLQGRSISGEVKLSFTGIADRFIKHSPGDVLDRLAEIIRIRERLISKQILRALDFQRLDEIQMLLEAETDESIRNLYRL